jgi:hypothetical protein
MIIKIGLEFSFMKTNCIVATLAEKEILRRFQLHPVEQFSAPLCDHAG